MSRKTIVVVCLLFALTHRAGAECLLLADVETCQNLQASTCLAMDVGSGQNSQATRWLPLDDESIQKLPAESLHLEVTPNTIVVSQTELLTINCSVTLDQVSNMSGITSMIVFKSVGKENQDKEQLIDLVSINVFTPNQIKRQPQFDGMAKGHLDNDGVSFIALEWLNPTDYQAGLFRCEVHGMDNLGFPTQMFQAQKVTSQQPNLDWLTEKASQLRIQIENQNNFTKNQQFEIKKLSTLAKTQLDQINVLSILARNQQSVHERCCANITTELKNLDTGLKSLGTNSTTELKNLGTDITTELRNLERGTTTELKNLGTGLNNLGTDITTELKNLGTDTTEELNNIGAGLKNLGIDITTELKNLETYTTTELRNLGTGLTNIGTDITTELKNLGADTTTELKNLGTGLKNLGTDITKEMKNLGTDITTELKNVGTELKNVMETGLEKLGAKLDSITGLLQYQILGKPQDWRECYKGMARHQNPHFPPRILVKLPGDKVALCDTQSNGGGWIVFQRRVDGVQDFYQDWETYENGFGNVATSYWLGLSTIHNVTSSGNYELRIDFEYDENEYYAEYSNFSIGDEGSQYTLNVSGFSGNVDDHLSWHNNMKFSTSEKDKDLSDNDNCAETNHGGWWYKDCEHVNLNGLYDGIEYKNVRWAGTADYGISFTEMKMRLK